MQFTPIEITIAGSPVTFGAESLTPQESFLRDMTSNLPYSALQSAKVGFSSPNAGRPSSFVTVRVYKTPIINDLGAVIGTIRTDKKTTTPLVATPADRAKHEAFVAGMEGSTAIKDQNINLVSWY